MMLFGAMQMLSLSEIIINQPKRLASYSQYLKSKKYNNIKKAAKYTYTY